MVELEALEENLKRFEVLGARVIALCPQMDEHNASAMRDLGLNFPVVTDRDNVVATAFGLTIQTPRKLSRPNAFWGSICQPIMGTKIGISRFQLAMSSMVPG